MHKFLLEASWFGKRKAISLRLCVPKIACIFCIETQDKIMNLCTWDCLPDQSHVIRIYRSGTWNIPKIDTYAVFFLNIPSVTFAVRTLYLGFEFQSDAFKSAESMKLKLLFRQNQSISVHACKQISLSQCFLWTIYNDWNSNFKQNPFKESIASSAVILSNDQIMWVPEPRRHVQIWTCRLWVHISWLRMVIMAQN